MKKIELHELSDIEVLALYSRVMEELQERDITHSTNNPVGNLAEHLVTGALSLERMTESTKGYDAVDKAGRKYEIKGRRPTKKNPSRQLSYLRELDKKHFDFLAGVLFNEDLSVNRGCLIPHSVVLDSSAFSKHANAWIFHLRDGVWSTEGVEDITEKLKARMANQAL